MAVPKTQSSKRKVYRLLFLLIPNPHSLIPVFRFPQTTNHKPQTTNHKPQTTNHRFPLFPLVKTIIVL
ncbi:MAG TPA: hypothetical protein ENN55_00130 [Firmicutes bacterium]|nr:hypothetical protein [Bacillota bacterium]